MKNLEKILEKVRDARKSKGFSHENMAFELGISQAAYTNMEKNHTKLTVERLLRISEILEMPVFYFLEPILQESFHQVAFENAADTQTKELFLESKEAYSKVSQTYENSIKNLKDEISFLRTLIGKTVG